MARPRKQTYTLEMYLKKIQSRKISNDADVQRNFVWKNEHINELIATVLTDDYIPPIILGEEDSSQLYIVDGGCRSTALMAFRYGNYKITSAIENSLIPYQRKITGSDGNVIWEEAVFDIKNKSYDKLPEELKEKFDEYQIETVIHEACDGSKISKYIKRYNNHVAMNTDQKAFTYLDKFAGRIHRILNSRFFADCGSYSEKDKTKGAVERIVVEAMMCIYHFDNWKTQAKAACKYLNENAVDEEFDAFAENLHRLERVITEDLRDIFNKKDSFIFLALFDRFVRLGEEDFRYAEFLRKFKRELRSSRRNENGLLFDEIDQDLSTKDKQVIGDKLNMLEGLIREFLHVKEADGGGGNGSGGDRGIGGGDGSGSDRGIGGGDGSGGDRGISNGDGTEAFIAENLSLDVKAVREDLDFYMESLDALLENTVKIDSKLRNKENRLSLLAMMVYSYKEDVDLDGWMAGYAAVNNSFFADQKKNFLHMKADFERFLAKKGRRSA